MARITVEDCLQKINNRFTVIHMAANRVRQLRKGEEPTIVSKNRDVVVALREIAAGNVVKAEKMDRDILTEDTVDLLSEELNAETHEESSGDKNEDEETSEGN